MRLVNYLNVANKAICRIILSLIFFCHARASNELVAAPLTSFRSSNLCSVVQENLSGPSFLKFPDIVSQDLPEDFVNYVAVHPITTSLRKKFGLGVDVAIGLPYLGIFAEVAPPGVKGEWVQTWFAAKVLNAIFPHAQFKTASEIETVKTAYPSAKFPFLFKVEDGAEFERYQNQKNVLQMYLLKAANPSRVKLPQNELRRILKTPMQTKVASLYLLGGLMKSVRHDSVRNPNFIEISKVFIGQGYKTILLSATLSGGGDPRVALQRDFSDVGKVFSRIILLSELNATSPMVDPSVPTLIINDTLGKVPYLHAAADVALVLGPINLFESLNQGCPTIVFNNVTTIGSYDLPTYERMIQISSGTGGLTAVDSIDTLSTAINVAVEKRLIKPPSLIKVDGENSVDRLLKNILMATEP